MGPQPEYAKQRFEGIVIFGGGEQGFWGPTVRCPHFSPTRCPKFDVAQSQRWAEDSPCR
ncbi:hypothetical protein ARMSODRAFT_947930 [Armillaria solidipes]|uniref:Uncharacterized protein n=1 Tax=Armillaria solidipes TaxID=1076256 RepID=A0A2H3CLL9_9AGAR|nr:hypothetical protein ARMSODRAFT_947930 [Armillaria solidipes]